ncbi:unnamed protein product [Polarella glacialis]|uniref:RRM domain-containing protein n=1 Tax=Polarella glacialis TaxID=89957 RepID=A0A813IB21_POLGL|nr:unnamed protein product [Polarella glacialis]
MIPKQTSGMAGFRRLQAKPGGFASPEGVPAAEDGGLYPEGDGELMFAEDEDDVGSQASQRSNPSLLGSTQRFGGKHNVEPPVPKWRGSVEAEGPGSASQSRSRSREGRGVGAKLSPLLAAKAPPFVAAVVRSVAKPQVVPPPAQRHRATVVPGLLVAKQPGTKPGFPGPRPPSRPPPPSSLRTSARGGEAEAPGPPEGKRKPSLSLDRSPAVPAVLGGDRSPRSAAGKAGGIGGGVDSGRIVHPLPRPPSWAPPRPPTARRAESVKQEEEDNPSDERLWENLLAPDPAEEKSCGEEASANSEETFSTVNLTGLCDMRLIDLDDWPTFFEDMLADVQKECASFGKVMCARVDRTSEFGTVLLRFTSAYAAEACLSSMDNRRFAGRQIEVSVQSNRIWRELESAPQ